MVREYTTDVTDVTDVIDELKTMAHDWASTQYAGRPEVIQAAEQLHNKIAIQTVRDNTGPGVQFRQTPDGRYVTTTLWRPGRHKIEPVILAHAMASIDEIRQSVITTIDGTL